MARIRPRRAAVWVARRYSSLNGRVRRADCHFTAGHWRVVVTQRWHAWEMWYPADAGGLARAQRQLRNAQALR